MLICLTTACIIHKDEQTTYICLLFSFTEYFHCLHSTLSLQLMNEEYRLQMFISSYQIIIWDDNKAAAGKFPVTGQPIVNYNYNLSAPAKLQFTAIHLSRLKHMKLNNFYKKVVSGNIEREAMNLFAYNKTQHLTLIISAQSNIIQGVASSLLH